jgi:hypothetical protein
MQTATIVPIEAQGEGKHTCILDLLHPSHFNYPLSISSHAWELAAVVKENKIRPLAESNLRWREQIQME